MIPKRIKKYNSKELVEIDKIVEKFTFLQNLGIKPLVTILHGKRQNASDLDILCVFDGKGNNNNFSFGLFDVTFIDKGLIETKIEQFELFYRNAIIIGEYIDGSIDYWNKLKSQIANTRPQNQTYFQLLASSTRHHKDALYFRDCFISEPISNNYIGFYSNLSYAFSSILSIQLLREGVYVYSYYDLMNNYKVFNSLITTYKNYLSLDKNPKADTLSRMNSFLDEYYHLINHHETSDFF